AEQIQLERLALHHADVRNVGDVDRREIGLAGNRTQARELGAIEFDEIIAARMLVVERLQHIRRVVERVWSALAAQMRNLSGLLRGAPGLEHEKISSLWSRPWAGRTWMEIRGYITI